MIDTIMGIDPGKETGVVAIRLTPNGGLQTLLDTSEDNVTAIREHIELFLPQVIVIETFRLYPARARALSWDGLEPVRVIGALEYIAGLLDIAVVWQQPSQIAPWRAYTKSLRRWKNVHARDAATHVIYYLLTKEKIPLDVLREELGNG